MRADGAAPVAIVTAMREELQAIVARAEDVRQDAGPFLRARIGAAEVVLSATGDGPPMGERGAASVCDAWRPAALLGAGIAGALSPELAAGDLVVSRIVRDAAGGAPSPDAQWLARAIACGGANAGTLVTVARPVAGAAEKAALRAASGAGPAAVDMESAAWARVAAARGIPYLIVRAIGDEAGEDLPEYLPDCVGPDGRIRRGAVALRALQRPSSVPALWRMRRRLREGSDRAAVFLERLLRREAS